MGGSSAMCHESTGEKRWLNSQTWKKEMHEWGQSDLVFAKKKQLKMRVDCECLTGLDFHLAPPCEYVFLSQRRETMPLSCSKDEHTCLMSRDTRASWDRERLSKKVAMWQSTSKGSELSKSTLPPPPLT